MRHNILLISDFNLSNLAVCLTNSEGASAIEVAEAPFGQVMQVLLQPDLECWKVHRDSAVLWTRPESVIEPFGRIVMGERVEPEAVLAAVDAFVQAVLRMSERVKAVFMPLWVVPVYQRGFGLNDMKADGGVSNILFKMNDRLSQYCERSSKVHLLNSFRWVQMVGKNAFDPKLWYMGKVAFDVEVFKLAARDILSGLHAMMGNARKLIIVDLDDTLWGGAVGDLGWESIVLGGHDSMGEAYVDFQRALKSLSHRGILLAIASRNEESIALEAVAKHPEMVLRLNDFVGHRISWRDKAQSIAELASEMRLGLQSVVFIDNNPVERARVREALPEVLVPEWPAHPMLYKSALLSLDCFDVVTMTDEDARRSTMYRVETERQNHQKAVGSLDEWIKGLNIKVTVEALNSTNLGRVAQLLNKTNQMNLATRRMSESEIMEWSSVQGHSLYAFRVADKFGDYGLVGIGSLQMDGGRATIRDYVLSCRVMGRRVEESLLHVLIKQAVEKGARNIVAFYEPTKKNKPCFEFFSKSGLLQDGQQFSWDAACRYPPPQGVSIDEISLGKHTVAN